MSTVHLLKQKSAQVPISRSDQTSSSHCSQTSFCPKSTLLLDSILIQRNLPQSGSTPTRFCPSTLLLQRPLPQRASATIPSGSTHSASKCLKLIVPLLQSPLHQRASAPMPLLAEGSSQLLLGGSGDVVLGRASLLPGVRRNAGSSDIQLSQQGESKGPEVHPLPKRISALMSL